ncbi:MULTISPECIES: hypothetical protein [Heyndrickxia]|uniref:Uncharacterized protein n=1 Tax=Heyndrickxia vini TaxID=1476025 RepID=A0ABX7DZ54_9BACI|nr:hypothetical protein [Heyndrickxia vini]QQZ08769.1 hypothetical protein I5776_17315 [Heyndrickxia vini]
MKNSLKWEKLYNQLNNISRPNESKINTFHLLEKKLANQKSIKNSPFINGISVIAVAFILAILSFSNLFNEPSNTKSFKTADNPYIEQIKGKKITRSFVSKSISDQSFTPSQYPKPLGVATIENDERWNKAWEKALQQLKKVKNPPTEPPQYDFMMYFNDEVSYKFKIWFKGKELIFKDITSKDYYSISTEDYSEQIKFIFSKLTEYK